MNTNTNTKKPSPKSSPDGADLNRRTHNLEIDNAAIKAEKLGWWAGLKVLGGAMLIMLSLMGTGYLDLRNEIEHVDTMVDKTHEIAVRTEAKVEGMEQRQIRIEENQDRIEENQDRIEDKLDLLIRADLEKHNAGEITLSDSTLRAIYAALGETPSDTISDAGDTTGDTPNTITISYVITGEALVVAPGDALGDTLGEGENLIIIASHP
ncbi:MAG: hypothetical protein MJE68_31135 [Proteobacteria bacterium]|nr:hypothetical protein [Pseudomonadota bacterium]